MFTTEFCAVDNGISSATSAVEAYSITINTLQSYDLIHQIINFDSITITVCKSDANKETTTAIKYPVANVQLFLPPS